MTERGSAPRKSKRANGDLTASMSSDIPESDTKRLLQKQRGKQIDGLVRIGKWCRVKN